MVRLEEVLAPGRRHRSRGADLEAERGGRDDLGEAVHLARAGAADRREPVARGGKRRSAADRADLEAALAADVAGRTAASPFLRRLDLVSRIRVLDGDVPVAAIGAALLPGRTQSVEVVV